MKKRGIFAWYGYFNDYRRRLEKIQNAGFDGIMLWWEDEIGDHPISRFEMARRAEEANLSVFNIHMAGSDDNAIWSSDRSTRENHLKSFYQTIEEIAALNYHNLVMHLCERGNVPDPGIDLLHSIEQLLPYAEANKMTLSLENTWRADYLEYVWEAFSGVKELGFCFDSSHANLKDQFYLLEKHKHRLSALHLSDNDGNADQHRLPFDGIIDFETKVLPFLTDNDIPFTMELIADTNQYPDEEEFLNTALQRVTALAEMTEQSSSNQEKNTEKENPFSLFPF